MTVQKAKPATTPAATKVTKKKPGSAPVVKAAAKTPALKKVAAAAVESKAPAAINPAATAPGSKAEPAVSRKPAAKPTPEERYRMVETAAYFIAEQHGFQGRSDEHWAATEREIAAKLGR